MAEYSPTIHAAAFRTFRNHRRNKSKTAVTSRSENVNMKEIGKERNRKDNGWVDADLEKHYH